MTTALHIIAGLSIYALLLIAYALACDVIALRRDLRAEQLETQAPDGTAYEARVGGVDLHTVKLLYRER